MSKVLPNLRKHNPDYPDANQLRSVMRVGNENIKDLWVAPPDMETKNTAGAQLIIDTLLDDDPRPVHVLSWGGANTTASALWKLKTEYPKEQVRLRRIAHPHLLHLVSGRRRSLDPEEYSGPHINEAYGWDNVWDYESYDHAAGSRANSVPTRQRIQEYMKAAWLNENVKIGHGPSAR